MSESCGTCKFWQQQADYPDNGKCRFMPPKPMYQVALDGSGGSYGDNLWPYTAKFEWCGQWSGRLWSPGASQPSPQVTSEGGK